MILLWLFLLRSSLSADNESMIGHQYFLGDTSGNIMVSPLASCFINLLSGPIRINGGKI